ncbi:transposase [Arthrobacter sp. AFG20]|uniref:transposase n=1 Tax=Arthrobacter sp. AFG20 TaxID=1688671 RepID=UPI000C9E434B|nr:hypothetical protein CXZ05_02515 [Arthrobacter sp. AFG20]
MVFIDAIQVKVRDGQVRNKPFYVVLGVTVSSARDALRSQVARLGTPAQRVPCQLTPGRSFPDAELEPEPAAEPAAASPSDVPL